jgi:hypothetical protein
MIFDNLHLILLYLLSLHHSPNYRTYVPPGPPILGVLSVLHPCRDRVRREQGGGQ